MLGDGDNRYAEFAKVEDTSGGLDIVGKKDSDGLAGLAVQLRGYLGENADTTKGTGGYGIHTIYGAQASGGSVANVTTGGNILAIRGRKSGGDVTFAIFAEDGDLYLDTSINEGEWDAYDDRALVETVRATALGEDHALRQRMGDLFEHNQQVLRDTGVMSEGGFLAMRQWTYLLADAMRQMWSKLDVYETEIIRLGGDPDRLALPVQQ